MKRTWNTKLCVRRIEGETCNTRMNTVLLYLLSLLPGSYGQIPWAIRYTLYTRYCRNWFTSHHIVQYYVTGVSREQCARCTVNCTTRARQCMDDHS
jgi:hypothetical protein